MSSLVSASTPSRFAFASAALSLASLSCSTVPESSREGTDAGVADGLCSGFFGGSGGTGLSVVGSRSLLGGLDSFTMLALLSFGTLLMGGVGFPKLALVNFGRDCGCQFDRTGCAYVARLGRAQPLNDNERATAMRAMITRMTKTRLCLWFARHR
jgi:hypothetical protein